jgi:hypothetical protein
MASISTMLVGKYIYSQLQVIGQSNFFLEATLNRMKSVVWKDKGFMYNLHQHTSFFICSDSKRII